MWPSWQKKALSSLWNCSFFWSPFKRAYFGGGHTLKLKPYPEPILKPTTGLKPRPRPEPRSNDQNPKLKNHATSYFPLGWLVWLPKNLKKSMLTPLHAPTTLENTPKSTPWNRKKYMFHLEKTAFCRADDFWNISKWLWVDPPSKLRNRQKYQRTLSFISISHCNNYVRSPHRGV